MKTSNLNSNKTQCGVVCRIKTGFIGKETSFRMKWKKIHFPYKCARISISPVDDSVVVQPDIVTIVTKSFRLAFVSPATEYETSLFIRSALSLIAWLEFVNNRSMWCKSALVFNNFDWAVSAAAVVIDDDTGSVCDDCFASIGNTPARMPVRLSSLQLWIIFVLLLLAIVSPTVMSFVSDMIEFRVCSCCCCSCICCWCRWFADVIIALVSVIVPMFGVDVVWHPLWLLLLFGVSAWWPWPLLLLPLIKFGMRSRLCRAR